MGVRVRGPWHDLGSPSLYLASQLALLERRLGRGRSLLGKGSHVAPGARVRRSVIGPGSVIEAGAAVSGSVLWENVHVGPAARVRGCVVTDRVAVPAGARLASATVLRGRRRRTLACVELTA
jgi:ADP-glucose pyrophosphorylase